MKIISWNVNGIRACWNHGLASFLAKEKADIYAFQEIKVNTEIPEIVPEGYEAFWSFCSRKKGYSGTLILTRFHPLQSWSSFPGERFDCEGRLITLDFGSFYLVNCYVPASIHSQARKDYRARWDELFFVHLKRLKYRKPTIVCGDFNAPLSDNDIYAESQWAEANSQGFRTDERDNLLTVIASGYTDTYRLLHPEETECFTWWSSRRYKRRENRGWRLDYFLVSDNIKESVTESAIFSDIMGSDHCPIALEISVTPEIPNNTALKAKKKKRIYYSDLIQYQGLSYLHAAKDSNLAVLWKSINWDQAENHLAAMQADLAKAASTHDPDRICRYQKAIVYSLDAKLLAVRHVCRTAGGAGTDGIKWTTAEEKMNAALSLTSKNYQAQPSRLLLIKSKNGKQRRIHIGTYYDRAMQILYAYSLDPIAESWGDRKSFAYRKGRSAYDLNEYIKSAFSGEDAPEWVFIGDVRKCYEHISHQWILENIPLAHNVLQEFLNAGYVFSGKLFPMHNGIGIGLSLSPIIANMTLDGLQKYIYAHLYPEGTEIDYANGNLIRYADDIIVAARTEEEALRIRKIVSDFLEVRGLELSPKKTRILPVSDGFTFMSRTYAKRNSALYAVPSDASVERFMNSLKETIENYTGSQKSLINRINRKIDGWTTYHKVGEADDAFRHIDVYIRALLLQLCEQKHPKWSREKILNKYWYVDYDGRHCYALPDKREIHVKFLSDVLLVDYNPVKTNVNPYIETEYLESRTNSRAILSASGVYRSIWNRQNGRCHYCGQRILRDEEKALIEADGSRTRMAARMAYVHKRCLQGSFDMIETNVLPETQTDVMALLHDLDTVQKPHALRYRPLSDFFRTCNKNSITLTFKQIEEIMGEPLGKTALRKEFWYRTGLGNISQCWLENGYEIKRLHLEERLRVTFILTSENQHTASVDIPEVFLNERIPDDAKYELENYFRYIIKKYGL